ncbi:hypothetical protein EDB80DRAFT_699630 [Ilyonectria destructans]|nr:hypothetical protein EDB80DRAFT_699630 [Ilyonectria destructans]
MTQEHSRPERVLPQLQMPSNGNQVLPRNLDLDESQGEQPIGFQGLPRERRRRLTTPSFLDNQTDIPKDRHLLRPIEASTRSESALSGLSFASIPSVRDRGIANHALWEHNRPQSSSVGSFSVLSRYRKIIKDKHITADILANVIYNALKVSEMNRSQKYLPFDMLETLINPESIEQILRKMKFGQTRTENVVKGVFGNGTCAKFEGPSMMRPHHGPNLRRIITILILIGQVQAIEIFIKNSVNDTILPLVVTSAPEGDDFTVLSEGAPDVDSTTLRQCFNGFHRRDVESFCLQQKTIHVPFFQFPGETSNVSFYDLDSDCILPYTEVGQPTRGGYGSVKKIRIHPAHHNFGGLDKGNVNPEFAVKTLLVDNDDQFRSEVEAFERLTPHKSEPKVPDHLIHLELAYRHGESHCLVFPWADGNLEQYWQLRQRDPADHKDVVWFFKQCHGITRGLRRLHNPSSYKHSFKAASSHHYTAEDIISGAKSAEYGRHGDIKPENILWFASYDDDTDHLAVSDFGLTEFNSILSKSHVKASNVNGYTGTYEPPDRQLDDEVTQKYDTWSLGCVFLEFVSWFLLGYEGGKQVLSDDRITPDARFRDKDMKDDKFYQMHWDVDGNSGGCAELKPSVVAWIEKIHGLNSCPKSIHKFLDVIQFGMLEPKAAKRSDCKMIRRDVHDIYNMCLEDSSYATKGYTGHPDPTGFVLERPAQETKNLDPIEAEERSPRPTSPQPDEFPELPEEMRQLPPPPDHLDAEVGVDTSPGDEFQTQDVSEPSLAIIKNKGNPTPSSPSSRGAELSNPGDGAQRSPSRSPEVRHQTFRQVLHAWKDKCRKLWKRSLGFKGFLQKL